MSDGLLAFYSRELDALRTLAGEFAAAHPKIAGRPRMSEGSVDDPHVERLLEGAAVLSARVQQRLDDELSEISDALLGVLYPNYQAPVPSAAIVRFAPRPDIRVPVKVPRGVALEADPVVGEPCRFCTTSDVTLWPIEIEQVRLFGLPLAAPAYPGAAGAASRLRAVLRLADPDASFAELGVGELRCFLRGPAEQALRLHELLCGHVFGVALADGPSDDRPTLLGASAVRPVGFKPDEALWPTDARSFSGLRLLGEYFALPEKFLFVDLLGLQARTLVQAGNRLELFIYLDRAAPDLERRLSADYLQLGCTPAVNLLPRKCEPIRLNGRGTEYPVHPEYRRPEALEVWSVQNVREVGDDGSSRLCLTVPIRTGLLGLTGPGGVLPRPYTEAVNNDQRHRSAALAAFLDILLWRSLANFAAAGIKYRPHRSADAAAIAGKDDAHKRDGRRDPLLALTGHVLPSLIERPPLGTDPIPYYAGAFASRSRSADRLAAILSDWFGEAVEVEQFACTGLALDPGERTALPREGAAPSSNQRGSFNRLGIDAAVGTRTWDIQSRIVPPIGPLRLDGFESLLPGRPQYRCPVTRARARLDREIVFVVNAVLAADPVPPPDDGTSGRAA